VKISWKQSTWTPAAPALSRRGRLRAFDHLSRIFSGPIDTLALPAPSGSIRHLSLFFTRRLPSSRMGVTKHKPVFSGSNECRRAIPRRACGRVIETSIDIGKNRCRCLTLRVAPEFQDCELSGGPIVVSDSALSPIDVARLVDVATRRQIAAGRPRTMPRRQTPTEHDGKTLNELRTSGPSNLPASVQENS
jgi:hypothetical protein